MSEDNHLQLGYCALLRIRKRYLLIAITYCVFVQLYDNSLFTVIMIYNFSSS